VAEQKEIREREMMAEQMSRGRSSTSITGKLASLLPSLYSRHSSDSGFHSRRDSRPPSLQVSRSASRAESVGSSIFSSDCLEDEPEPSVRVVPGGDVTESYRLGTLLGEGAFSKVFLAESLVEPGGLAAVKVIDKAELCKEEDKMFLVDKEIEIMSQLDHPHIVRLYEVYENEAEVCLVMELAKGGELFDRLLEAGSLGEREAGRVMGQVLSAVADLHSRGIVHRDLKPENLLYYDNRSGSPLLVADFGLSEYEDQLSARSAVCGTATYLAPEVISQTLSSRAQDLWSCGVIAYILLCGYPPFCKSEDEGEESLLRQIVQGRLHFHPQFWDSVSDEAEDFVRRLLVADPGLRMTVEEAQLHPWIRKMNTREPTLGCASLCTSAFLVIFLLTATVFLHLFLLTDYFDLETELLERTAEIICRLFHWLKRHSEFLIIVRSFLLDLRLFDQCNDG